MIDNAILKENTQFFNFSKRTVDQMEFIKKDIKSIIDDIKLKAKIKHTIVAYNRNLKYNTFHEQKYCS